MPKTRIRTDRMGQYHRHMDKYGMGMGYDAIPVDLYGKRVGGSMEEQGEEIKEFYDLDTQGYGGGEK